MDILDDKWIELYIGITVNVIIATAIAFLFKYVFKPKIENVFEKNTKYVDDLFFSHISFIDSYKKSIFNHLESNSEFNPDTGKMYRYSKPIYDEIFRYRELILNEIERIQNFKNLPGSMTLENFLKVQRYTSISYTFIEKVGNVDDGIFYNPRELERQRFYAKEIIESFGKSADQFYLRWRSEFAQVGGIHNVKFRMHEPGDIVGLDVNLNDELLLWDPRFSALQKDIQKLKESLSK
jgi:hypothetical protein